MKKKIFFLFFLIINLWPLKTLRENKEFNTILTNAEYLPSSIEIEKFGNEMNFLNGYRLRNIDLKKSRFTLESIARGDQELKAQALYNIGNLFISSALENGDNALFELAIKYYESALRHKADFKEAKYNLELAKKLNKLSPMPRKKLPEKLSPDQNFYPRTDQDI